MSQVALITGASAGLGVEFARLFAARKVDVVLVARREDRLKALASELEASSGIKAHVIAADLSTQAERERVVSEVSRLGLTVEYLVNNAGFGTLGRFAELDGARELEMIDVNISALVALTHAFAPGMVARRSGRILNVGSAAGFQPGPFMATYYASKAFVNSFTEALSHELSGSGVTATVSCPGPTATEFGDVSGNGKSELFKSVVMTAPEVAQDAFKSMMAGRALTVHGLKNKIFAASVRFAPRSVVRAIAGKLNSVKGASA